MPVKWINAFRNAGVVEGFAPRVDDFVLILRPFANMGPGPAQQVEAPLAGLGMTAGHRQLLRWRGVVMRACCGENDRGGHEDTARPLSWRAGRRRAG